LAIEGEQVPELEQQPELYDDLWPFWNIFLELCASRGAGFSGPNPICYTEIESVLNIHNIKDESIRQRTTHLVKILDTVFIKAIQTKEKKHGRS
jgi:hypothetical protein